MYYSAGNFEAFAHPKKPEGLENKSAYIIGTGLAALTAAFYLVRDAQMPGKNIHVFDKDVVPGGALDGAFIKGEGYVMRGGREMDNHFEVMWDVYRDVPSIEDPNVSMLDHYYWLNKETRTIRSAAPPRHVATMRTPTTSSISPTRGAWRSSSSTSPPRTSSPTRRSPTTSTTKCSIRISGCTGAPCSPSRTGIPRSRCIATSTGSSITSVACPTSRHCGSRDTTSMSR